jgi:hypothetical protein
MEQWRLFEVTPPHSPAPPCTTVQTADAQQSVGSLAVLGACPRRCTDTLSLSTLPKVDTNCTALSL